jgi:hypothetical protein
MVGEQFQRLKTVKNKTKEIFLVSFTNWNAREIDEILLRANSFLQFLPLP